MKLKLKKQMNNTMKNPYIPRIPLYTHSLKLSSYDARRKNKSDVNESPKHLYPQNPKNNENMK